MGLNSEDGGVGEKGKSFITCTRPENKRFGKWKMNLSLMSKGQGGV